MKIFAIATLLTAVSAIALPHDDDWKYKKECPAPVTKYVTVYKTETKTDYKTEYKTKTETDYKYKTITETKTDYKE